MAAIIDTVQVSGPGRQLVALARHLEPLGVEFLVVTVHRVGRPASPYVDFVRHSGVRHTVITERGPFDARTLFQLRSALASWRPNVVQTHGYKPTALAYMLRRLGARWPWIAFFHGTTSENLKTRLYHGLDRRLMARADKVVTMSRRQRAAFSHLGAKACVVYNAVIPLSTPEGGRSGTALPPRRAGQRQRRVIGVVGRLSPEKGVDVFLRACGTLAQRNVAFSAIVAGDGPQRRALEALRDSLDLREHVELAGVVSAPETVYAQLDLLVIPSRSEGLPNVLLEALHADLPVVATRVGAIPEVIDSPLAGTLVPPDAPGALADAIEASLSTEDTTDASAARRTVAERFSLERRASEHLKLYADVLHRPERSGGAAATISGSGLARR